MKITLDLSNHCIETEVKRRYNRALSEYFRFDGDRLHIEQVIELTRQAIDVLDFRRLRSDHPALAGGTDAVVVLYKTGDRLEIAIDGVAVNTNPA